MLYSLLTSGEVLVLVERRLTAGLESAELGDPLIEKLVFFCGEGESTSNLAVLGLPILLAGVFLLFATSDNPDLLKIQVSDFLTKTRKNPMQEFCTFESKLNTTRLQRLGQKIRA